MESYNERKGLNQSSLKKILISPQEFLKSLERSDSTADHFAFGTAVDIMLTGSQEEFQEKFYEIEDETSLSDVLKTIADGIYEHVTQLIAVDADWSIQDDVILQHIKFQNYQANWKDETRVAKVKESIGDYMKIKAESAGKTLITKATLAKAKLCVMALRQDTYTSYYCQRDVKYVKDSKCLDKFIVEFSLQGLDIKGELDRVIIDHTNQTIQPIDFKTTSKPMSNFISDFWYYRYDFQAAVYSLGLTMHPDIKSLLEQGYELKNFLYIVVNKDLTSNPMAFEVSQSALQIGLGGGTVRGKDYEGFLEALHRYTFASDNDAWEYPMEYYQLNGKMPILV